ncbi:MAG: hypothetical protein ABSG70_14765 [Terriglobales bacterium]|jgi:hypothetical protein
MTAASESISVAATDTGGPKKNASLAIVAAGLIAGTVNILYVCIHDGWDIPYYIAAGLIGRTAINGGAIMWSLGMALHFLISCIWATVYYLASRKLPLLTEHPLLSGVNFGVWVELFMKLIVLPHSGLHATEPVGLPDLIGKVLLFGLPVAYTIRYLAPARAPRQIVPS